MVTTMEQHISDPSNKEGGVEKLILKLDDLLEQYLNLLDQYQTTRQQLSTQLSSVRKIVSELGVTTDDQKGYISLAQANFSSTNRARYGQDYYDERMQALRKV
jgi:hypothetical protein